MLLQKLFLFYSMRINVANDSLLVFLNKFMELFTLTTFIPMFDIRFHFWPYIKLMIIFWLIIPDFGRASYVYNNLIRPMKLKIVTWRLNNYWRKCFAEKDDFLMHAERYMKENGTEALEKLLASKVITTMWHYGV
jgi:hypothetical protein